MSINNWLQWAKRKILAITHFPKVSVKFDVINLAPFFVLVIWIGIFLFIGRSVFWSSLDWPKFAIFAFVVLLSLFYNEIAKLCESTTNAMNNYNFSGKNFENYAPREDLLQNDMDLDMTGINSVSDNISTNST